MSLKGVKRLTFIFNFLTILQTCLAGNNFKHKARKNYKFKEESILEEISSKSLADCLIYCSLQKDCISVSFRSPTDKCLLSSSDTTNDAGKSPGIPKTLIFAEGWTTMTRIRYPVFHALGQYDRYSMTFKQAKQQCIDYGTIIASPSELIQARSMGYAMCVCSWMSDGRNGLVVQEYKSGCGFSETIKYCSLSKANVFCKLK